MQLLSVLALRDILQNEAHHRTYFMLSAFFMQVLDSGWKKASEGCKHASELKAAITGNKMLAQSLLLQLSLQLLFSSSSSKCLVGI